jgi:hypothetical protein
LTADYTHIGCFEIAVVEALFLAEFLIIAEGVGAFSAVFLVFLEAQVLVEVMVELEAQMDLTQTVKHDSIFVDKIIAFFRIFSHERVYKLAPVEFLVILILHGLVAVWDGNARGLASSLLLVVLVFFHGQVLEIGAYSCLLPLLGQSMENPFQVQSNLFFVVLEVFLLVCHLIYLLN